MPTMPGRTPRGPSALGGPCPAGPQPFHPAAAGMRAVAELIVGATSLGA